jgi:hypothetical protein
VEILGVNVPHVLLPVSPGRNLSTLVETALRVHLLRLRGYNAAENFIARHTRMLRTGEGDEREDSSRPGAAGATTAVTTAGRQAELTIDEPEKKSS